MVFAKHIIRISLVFYSFLCILACSHSYDRFNNDIKIITKPSWTDNYSHINRDKFIAVSKNNVIGNIKDRMILAESIALSKLKLVIKIYLEDFIQKQLSLMELEIENTKFYQKIIKNIIHNTTINNSMLNNYAIREETFVEPDTNDLFIMMSIRKSIIKKEIKKQIEIVLKKNKDNKQLFNFFTKLSTNISSNF